MMLDESFVVASASIIFIVLTFKYCKSAINTMAENRIKNISNKFDEVLQIKIESENLLKEQQILYASSEQKIKEILLSAENEINQLKEKAALDLDIQLKNKTKNIQQKINDQEQKSLAELRLKALILAISSSISISKLHKKNDVLLKFNKESLNIMSHQLKEITFIS